MIRTLNYRTVAVIILCFLLVLSHSGCNINTVEELEQPTSSAETSTTEEITYAVFPQDYITINGTTAQYNDGKISFQWDTTEWYLHADKDGFPELDNRVGLMNVHFRVFDCVEGTVGGLAEFAGSSLQSEIDDYDAAKQFFFSYDENNAEQNKIGITTGYYTHKEEREDNILILIHSVTNGKTSCVYGLWFESGGEEVANLHDKLSETHDYNVLEDYGRSILESFRLID